MITLEGKVAAIPYNRDDYYVLHLEVNDGDTDSFRIVTAAGSFYGLRQIRSGVQLNFLGTWKKHPKFGRQFQVSSWEPPASNLAQIELFLNVCVPGWVNSTLVKIVVSQFGLDTFKVLSTDPAKVLNCLAVGSLEAEQLQQAVLGWEQALACRDLSTLLKTGGLGSVEIQAALIRFGAEAPKVIKENPFRLMEIQGLDFAKVDRLAMALGGKLNDPRRIEGGILWALQEASRNGHLYLRRVELLEQMGALARDRQVLPFPQQPEVLNKAVQTLVARKALVLEPSAGIYLPSMFQYERDSAKMLSELLSPSTINIDLKPFLEEYQRSNRMELSEAQQEGVKKLAENRVLVLTGLPGTGKTTAVRALVRLFEESRVTFALMAPTGIAAKRLAAVTSHDASTIHRALKYDGLNWGHGIHNKYVVDAVIVDEVSMVDQELLYRLLTALRPDTILVLVGDDAQLPSVGPGNVLRELVACQSVPSVKLTQIFRQSVKGDIVQNSHKIHKGETLSFSDPLASAEFKFIRSSDSAWILKSIVETAVKHKEKDNNFQVLAPKYEGIVGVDNLNLKLREALNPEGPKEWEGGGQRFRVGDRVMVVQNDYKLNVYNGDVGKLVYITHNTLVVRIHGAGAKDLDMEVAFPVELAAERLRLAYAITVHKCQGNEFDHIIMPIVKTQGRMLQRNLLYTAVTRARKCVWLFGEEAAVTQAVNNNHVIRRNTMFGQAITAWCKKDTTL